MLATLLPRWNIPPALVRPVMFLVDIPILDISYPVFRLVAADLATGTPAVILVYQLGAVVTSFTMPETDPTIPPPPPSPPVPPALIFEH